jgi:DNA helicase HerA-like ATPase
MSLLKFFARLAVPHDRRRAAKREQARVARYVQELAPRDDRPRASDLLGPDGLPLSRTTDSQFVLGTPADDERRLFVVNRREIVASHSITYGATGAGKTFLWLLILDQELRRTLRRTELGLPQETAIVVLEPKHDFAPSFLKLLAGRLAAASPAVAERVLAELTTFNPMGRFVVPLPLLTPEPDVSPELHATALSGLIGRLSGSPFGPKQRPILDVVLLLFMLERLTLPEGVELLGNWERLRALARRSPSDIVRSFFEENARVPAGSLDGIRARLLRLVFAPNLRAMFSAREGLDFDELMRPGRITVLDVGGSQGDEDLTAFFSGLVLLKLGRAIRRRPNGASPVIVVIDEFQRILHGEGDVAEQAATLLETTRSRGVALHLLTQSAASVSAISPRLVRAIHTNAAVEILGATDNAAELAHLLPVTGRRPRPSGAPWETQPSSPWLSREEELRMLVERTQALPPRHFWVRPTRRSPRATLTKTLGFFIPDAHDARLVQRIERGCLGRDTKALAQCSAPPRVRILGAATDVRAPRRRPRGLP